MFYSTNEVAQLLGRRFHQVTYLLRSNPSLDVAKVNGRRGFTGDDILRLAKAFRLPASDMEYLRGYLDWWASTEAEQSIRK